MSSVLASRVDGRMVLINMFLADSLLLCSYLVSCLSEQAFINFLQ
jgi:hypothetical protein